jgi:hypothetical protein
MPKYEYTELRVVCLEGPYYRVDQLREAVERLKREPQTGYTGLAATTHVMVGKYPYECKPMLQLADIVGKTPAEVWDLFDAKTTDNIAIMAAQWSGEKYKRVF